MAKRSAQFDAVKLLEPKGKIMDQPPVYYNTAALASCTPDGDCWKLGAVSALNGDYHHKCWSQTPDLEPCKLIVREIVGNMIVTKTYKFSCVTSAELAGGVQRTGGAGGTTLIYGYFEVT